MITSGATFRWLTRPLSLGDRLERRVLAYALRKRLPLSRETLRSEPISADGRCSRHTGSRYGCAEETP